MNYKDTLLMPKTDFEMKGKLPSKEPKILERWDEMDLFALHMEERKDRETFVLHDGPPYANGDIHIGHGLNKVIKDIVNRSKAMQGYLTPYIPGWDTHGLPIEVAITKTGVDRKKMSIAEFRSLCEKYAYEQIEIQKAGFLRLGSFGDYKNPYITLTKSYEAAQIRVFAKMAMDGIIYQGFKPVYWSPSSETALAEGELEYYDRVDPSIYIKFNVVDGKGVLETDTSFVCWTTMPWTLTGTVGVALGEAFTYGLYESDKFGKVIVAKDLAEQVFEVVETKATLIKEFNAKDLEYIVTSNPLNDVKCPIILGDHVTTDGGTGCVTTAPGHGTEDFLCGKKYGLDLVVGCDIYGKMYPETGEDLAGLYWEKANVVVIEKIKSKNKLLKVSEINHSYPFDWRTKKPIIFRAAKQWFASIEKKREEILEQIEQVKWTPSWGQVRMHNMIRDRGDWCISRQRVWGVPIPIVYDENMEPILDNDIFEFVATKFEEHGSNYWFDSNIEDVLPENFKENNPNYLEYTKETDIMDVWFDSGSSWAGCIEARGMSYPVDMYLEGSDQYRGWFNSSLIVGTCYHGKAPYKEVLSHGFTLDGKGNKMSKSQGNVIDPAKIMNQYGADIFRFWVASVDYQSDVRISDDVIKQIADAYRKVRNTFKFILGNLNNFDDSMLLSFDELEDVDKYMLVKLNRVNKLAIDAYNAYEYSSVYQLVNSFIAKELSAFYMDFTKDILYIVKEDDLRRRQVQTVLYHALETIVMLLTPFLPFTMEETYDFMPKQTKKKSVHLEEFVSVQEYPNTEDIVAKFDKFMRFRDDVLKAIEIARENKVVGKSLEAKLIIALNEEFSVIKDIKDLHQLCIVSGLEIVDEVDGTKLESATIKVEKHTGTTCARCWNVVDDAHMVGDICDRCHGVLNS